MDDNLDEYKEFLLNEIRRFYKENNRLPKVRDMYGYKGYPSKEQYKKHFGGLLNAIQLCGFELDNLTVKLSNRKPLDKEVVTETLKNIVDKFVSENNRFPSQREIYETGELTQFSVEKFYKSVDEMFKAIGYSDYKEIILKKKESRLIREYLEMKDFFGHYPNSREIAKFNDKFPEKGFYSTGIYLETFGTLSEFQKHINIIPTKYGKSITTEELITNLKLLRSSLECPIMRKDIEDCPYLPSPNVCFQKLDVKNIDEMNMLLFNEKSSKIKYTKKGTMCFSSYEVTIARTLEEYNYIFEKDVLYNKFGIDIPRLTTDFVIYDKQNNPVFIEIFGIVGKDEYDKKTQQKIDLCKNANIKLIELYPEDFYNMSHKKWNDYIQNKIS